MCLCVCAFDLLIYFTPDMFKISNGQNQDATLGHTVGLRLLITLFYLVDLLLYYVMATK
jgi:hypothetical protein